MKSVKQLRENRVVVLLTADEKARFESLASVLGMAPSTFIRVKALEAIRGQGITDLDRAALEIERNDLQKRIDEIESAL